MSGRGKRQRAAGSSGGSGKVPPKRKLIQKPSPLKDWCADCWANVKDTCGRGGHRLVEKDVALREAKAKLKGKEAKMKTLKQDVVQAQERVNVVARAFISKGPVLELTVEYVEAEWSCVLNGGAVRLSLAASATAAEKTAICQALEGLTIDYDGDLDEPHGNFSIEILSEFFQKLPSSEAGNGRPGAVTLSDKGELTFHLSSTTFGSDKSLKLFGRMDNGMDGMQALSCCGGCRDCERGYPCQHPDEFSTTLSQVKILE